MGNYDTIRLMRPHKGQRKIIKHKRRFNAIVCARRFGKTEFIASVKFPLIWGAVSGSDKIGIFVPAISDFSETWEAIIERFGMESDGGLIRKKNETNKTLRFVNGGIIKVWSLTNVTMQNNGRGRKYHRIIYEETQKIDDDILKYHFEKVGRILLTDYKGDCWFIGTASGKGNYWHTLCQRGAATTGAQTNAYGEEDLKCDEIRDDWATFRMTTYTNPHIDPEEIEDAKKDIDQLTFDQEYMSVFVDYTGRPWCYALADKSIQQKVFVKSQKVNLRAQQLFIGFDFNKIPMTALVMIKKPLSLQEVARTQYRYGPQFIKEFKIGSIEEGEKSIYHTCQAIREWILSETGVKMGKWDDTRHPTSLPFLVTGDASGNHSDGRQKVPLTYYEIIQEELCLPTDLFDIKKANPLHAESFVQVNTLLQQCPLFEIWEDTCPGLRQDTLRIKTNDSRGIVKGKGQERQADLLDNMRYLLNTFCKDIRL